MTKEKYIAYLRTQAYWINVLADEIEQGKTPSCEWCVDLPLPEMEQEQRVTVQREVKTA